MDTLKNPTKCLWRWEPDRRSNIFFNPPEHLCAVTYNWNIVACDVKQPFSLTLDTRNTLGVWKPVAHGVKTRVEFWKHMFQSSTVGHSPNWAMQNYMGHSKSAFIIILHPLSWFLYKRDKSTDGLLNKKSLILYGNWIHLRTFYVFRNKFMYFIAL